jgi:hypothetical protein
LSWGGATMSAQTLGQARPTGKIAGRSNF